jgi:hypothetical protein
VMELSTTRLVQLATSTDSAGDTQRQALWVLGHHGDVSLAPVLRDVAHQKTVPVAVRTVAAYAWYRLVPGDVLGEAVAGSDVWPPAVVLPILWDRVDADWADAHRQWTRRVAAGRTDLAHAATLALGDAPNEVVSWAFMADAELTALGLPTSREVDWSQAYMAGAQWASDPPRDFFGRQAVMDAHRWAQRILKQRIAALRYYSVRQWEAWLREALGETPEVGLSVPEFTPILLTHPTSAVEATALLVLGAFSTEGGQNRPADVSSRLSSAGAAAHLNTAETYHNAQISGWHVGAMTGHLAIRLSQLPFS